MPDISKVNCDNLEDFKNIFEWISVERWTNSNSDFWKEHLTPEEYKAMNEHNTVFCYFKDFDAYYTDFYEYFNIDLMTSNIDWFRFNWFLDKLMGKEDSQISKRVSFRNYKPNKHDTKEYKEMMLKNKDRYSLKEQDYSDLYNSMKGDK